MPELTLSVDEKVVRGAERYAAVFLDIILDRRPDADVAAALWAAIERGQGHGMVPAHGVTTIFYLLEKARDHPVVRR